MRRPQAYLICLTLIVASFSCRANDWVVDYVRSHIGFVASYDSIDFSGRFERWRGSVKFDPAKLSDSKLHIEVDMASVDTASRDRDVGMRSAEWFDASQFGQARYLANVFKALGEDQFQANAVFRIKGQDYPLQSNFTWAASTDTNRRLRGSVVVDRRTFNIGTGEWANEPIIGFKVKIVYDLHLQTK